MKRFKLKKLSTAFLLPIILTVFCVLMAFTIVTAFNQKEKLTNELINSTEKNLTITADAAGDAFWTYNDVSIQKIGETVVQIEEIASIEMLDDKNHVVYTYKKDTPEYQNAFLYPEFIQEIVRRDQKIGEIRLTVTTYFLDQAIFSSILLGFGQTLLTLFLIVILIVFLSRNLTAALDKIAIGVKSFTEGDRTSRIDVRSTHEVGNLVNGINHLFDTIVATRRQLDQNYDALAHQKEELRISEERYRYAVDGSNDAVWDWDLATEAFYVSRRGYQMLGILEPTAMTLENWITMIHPQDQSRFKNYLQCFSQNVSYFGQLEFRVIGSKGEVHWLFGRGKGIFNQQQELIRVSGFFTDITERIQAEEAINRLAYYDVLTGLTNRAKLYKESNQLFEEQAQAHKTGALLYIDLDNFKTINDTRGHAVGDKVLVEIANSLVKNIHYDTIARIGGDEFVVIRRNCSDLEASNLASHIINIISRTWYIDDFEFDITCSIGITLFPQDGTDINRLLMNADSALYDAKEHGKDQFKFFDQSTNEMMVKKIELQADIRRGIQNREFVLYYQPQVDLRTGQIIGVEALIRWQHPKRGLLSPFEFIGPAEESGLILPLGEKILTAACEQSVAWEKAGHKNIAMAVNFSARQFNKKDVVAIVLNILDQTGMRPELLDIEITESIAMDNLENTLSIIERLKKYNIKFSLDDFGTGYSSLNYLHKLPIDHLKIDKQFVQSIHPGSFEEVVVKATAEIAHSMNLIVIAEGVETPEQYQAIAAFKVDQGQGYLFSRPLPAAEIEKLLNASLIPD
jgi:diguanylate cyclase (GGDEF)-like protein/PAS domain S-box-containing protein